MADFRKLVYVLALVALFTGLTVSANAQGMFCDSFTGVNQLVRAEGYTEQVGNLELRCHGSIDTISTPAGQAVPRANIFITIPGTTVTSRTVATNSTANGNFIEPLLLVDDPGQGPTSASQLYCGHASAPDNTSSGKGICPIISDGNPVNTYNGTTNHPNIFQARPSVGAANTIVFPGVPLDPPGTNGVRVFRITNIRVDATQFNPDSTISAIISIEAPAGINLQNTSAIVATVKTSLNPGVVTADTGYLQCVTEQNSGHNQAQAIVISEKLRSAFKPRNINEYFNNYNSINKDYASWLNSSAPQYQYDGSSVSNLAANEHAQNVPQTQYFTEDGFVLDAALTAGAQNGINTAGKADYGTRITLKISAPPTGTTLTIPTTVYLSNASNSHTGVMVMTGFTGTGTGAYTPVSTSTVAVPAAGATYVYEVLFADPFTLETATILPVLTYGSTLTDAAIGVATTVSGISYAPNYATAGGDSNGIPRFAPTPSPAGTLVQIGKCSCSLLFPWVVSDSSYVTGFAISNTSMDPSNSANTAAQIPGYSAVAQSGKVTMYFFGQQGTNPTQSGTPVQPVSAPSATVAAGSFATFLAPLPTTSGTAFAGYAIANAQFQYCHGVAFLFSSVAGVPPMSYLGLVMDGKVGSYGYGNSSVGQYSGYGGAVQLQRTTQAFKDALDN